MMEQKHQFPGARPNGVVFQCRLLPLFFLAETMHGRPCQGDGRECICGTRFPTKTGLERHLGKMVRGGIPCNFCELAFYTTLDILRHMRSTHKIPHTWVCRHCKALFYEKGQWMVHKPTCKSERLWSGVMYRKVETVDGKQLIYRRFQ